jgi:hypothetical protein
MAGPLVVCKCEGVSKSFRTESIRLPFILLVAVPFMAAKLTKLTHKIAIQLHLGTYTGLNGRVV